MECEWSLLRPGRVFSNQWPFPDNIVPWQGATLHTCPGKGNTFIYEIRNHLNGKVYVGLTAGSLQQRWENHRSMGTKWTMWRRSRKRPVVEYPLYRDMRVQGLQAFIMSVIEECPSSQAKIREFEHMRRLDSWNPSTGYNHPSSVARYHALTGLNEHANGTRLPRNQSI